MNNTTTPEDMASFEVLHTQNHSSPNSFPSGEYSFLPEVASTSIPNGDISHHVNGNFDLANMQSALATTVPDSTVEIHSQLLKVIEENNSLKDILKKNNSMMEEQMSAILQWRKHMISAKDQQQQSLEKAKEEISVLEEKNAELCRQLENVGKFEKEKTQPCMKCTIFEDALNNMLAIDSVEDGESIILELGCFRDNLLQNLITFCPYVENLANTVVNEEEKKLLKTFVLLLKFKISALECGNLRTTVHTDEEFGYEVVHQKAREKELQLCQDIEDLKRVIDSKNNELVCLRKEKGEFLEKELKLKEYEMVSKSQFELMNKKSEIDTSLVEKYKERCECLQQQIEEYQLKLDKASMSNDHLVKDLREEVRNLQDILKLEQIENKSAKDRLSEVMLKFEFLQVDYDRVSKLLEVESKSFKEKHEEAIALWGKERKDYLEEIQELKTQLLELEKIDQLTAQIFEMQEQMRECAADIRRLNSELAEVKEENEIIPILKAQIEVYKSDFENMAVSKDAASDEVERLKNELKKFEQKCDSCPSAGNSQASASGGQTSSRYLDHKGQCNETAECPFCHEEFKNEYLANRHILRSHGDE